MKNESERLGGLERCLRGAAGNQQTCPSHGEVIRQFRLRPSFNVYANFLIIAVLKLKRPRDQRIYRPVAELSLRRRFVIFCFSTYYLCFRNIHLHLPNIAGNNNNKMLEITEGCRGIFLQNITNYTHLLPIPRINREADLGSGRSGCQLCHNIKLFQMLLCVCLLATVK